jgi:nicotinamide mononucleotide (NMN) deamidase PncC
MQQMAQESVSESDADHGVSSSAMATMETSSRKEAHSTIWQLWAKHVSPNKISSN